MKVKEKMTYVGTHPGFIAALDQSGGSTPKALAAYGVMETAYDSEEAMFDAVQTMRARIMTSPVFTSKHILGVILFEKTMDRKIEGQYTPDYLWDQKRIPAFLKIDQGLADQTQGVQLMKPIPGLNDLLARANSRHIFGTKMRSVIHEANRNGIQNVVDQQFAIAETIAQSGLIPIIEPEVNIHAPEKEAAEALLLECLTKAIDAWDLDTPVMFKLTLPTIPNLYEPLTKHPKVLRVVALSGGYSIEEANRLLKENNEIIASFSRALVEGLNVNQSQKAFDQALDEAITSIYDASVHKK